MRVQPSQLQLLLIMILSLLRYTSQKTQLEKNIMFNVCGTRQVIEEQRKQ